MYETLENVKKKFGARNQYILKKWTDGPSKRFMEMEL